MSRRRAWARLGSSTLLVCAVNLACGDGVPCDATEAEGFAIRFDDPSGSLSDFGAHPWPSDALRRGDGSLRLDHFPNVTESSTLEDYLRIIQAHTRAYATSAAFYLAFDADADPASLPADPGAALAEDATVRLVDIDPDSPERGRQFPLTLRYRTQAGLHLPAFNLTGLPLYGSGLRSDTTYAVLLSPKVRGVDGAALTPHPRLRAALSKGCRDTAPATLFAALAPLRDFIDDGFVDDDEVAGATVFTTQAAVEELRALTAAARAYPVPAASGWAFEGGDARTFRLRAELELPGFQSGERPYRGIEDGGGLLRGDDGGYQVDHTERTRVGVALPQAGTMPAGGWPVVLYSHGTGGDYASAFSDEVAGQLGRLGIAVVGYDQTLHGPRDPTGSDPNLTFFNLFNPLAARDNVRQGAADLAVMTSVLAQLRIPADVTAGRGEVRFDPARIAFVGHSQGSLVGAPFAAADPRPVAHVFSGLGAVLTLTMLLRKDIVNFESLLHSLLGYPEDVPLDELDPVLNLLQTFIERADPIAYADSYLSDPPEGVRSDILMVEGFLDFASPARGQEAFSVQAGLPVVAPLERLPEAAAVLGPAAQTAPAQANVVSAAGPATFGLLQYPNETHFPIFENANANRRFVEFVRSAILDGAAVIPE